MRKTKNLLTALLGFLLLAGCGEMTGYLPDDIDGNSSNLPGTWNFYQMTQTSWENGIQQTPEISNDLGTITFNSGGNGSYSLNEEGEIRSGSFNWVEDDDRVYMNLINPSDSLTTDNFAIVFDVTTNTATQQIWEASMTLMMEDYDPNGNPITAVTRNDFLIDLRKQ